MMMNKIFQSIETELNSLIALGDKIDSFHSLYMLVKMSHHVWTAENVDPASYLSTTLGNVLVTVKRNFDKCIVSSGLWSRTIRLPLHVVPSVMCCLIHSFIHLIVDSLISLGWHNYIFGHLIK